VQLSGENRGAVRGKEGSRCRDSELGVLALQGFQSLTIIYARQCVMYLGRSKQPPRAFLSCNFALASRCGRRWQCRRHPGSQISTETEGISTLTLHILQSTVLAMAQAAHKCRRPSHGARHCTACSGGASGAQLRRGMCPHQLWSLFDRIWSLLRASYSRTAG
jgi:hypothetical protein